MRIYTLGTRHGGSTLSRFNSSTVYETERGSLYLIDAGAPVEALMKRRALPLGELRACFITHMHDDHAGGLTSLVKQVTKHFGDRPYPFSLYLPEEDAIAAFSAWFSALHEDPAAPVMRYHTVTDGVVYDDDELKVTAIRTKHLRTDGRELGEPCSFAYVLDFKTEGKKILHTGDLYRDFSDFPAISADEHFDVCLCEATHYSPESARDALLRAKFDKLIFIHIHDRWHNDMRLRWGSVRHEGELLEYCRDYPYPCVVAHDGDEFLI